MKNTYFFLIIISITGFCSCKNVEKREVVGEVAGQKIYLDEVDRLIKNSLYEYLFAIFDVRNIAANELINSKLIEMEAAKRRMSIDSMITVETLKIGKKITKSQYVMQNALGQGVVDEGNPFRLLPLDSYAGKKVLNASYLRFLKIEMVKGLREKYGAKIFLDKPETPIISLNGISRHTRGNLESDNSIIIISDFNCPVCKSKESVFREIFNVYKGKMRFEYINLSSGLNNSILFSECAGKQGKFWEAYDLLFQRSVIDSADINNMIGKMKLRKADCLSCISSVEHKKMLSNEMEQLRADGIQVTPTILINKRIYYGEVTGVAMTRFIDDIIK